MRGRNNNRNKGPNPLTRSYESNGPDVKIRGTAQHVADKYAQLARDAQSSGDPVAAENYHQHAEHYYRIIAAAQEQFREQFGSGYQRPMDEDGDEDSPGYGGEAERPMPQHGEDGDMGSQPQPFELRADQGGRQDRFDRGDRQDRGDRGGDRGDRFQGRDRFGRGDRPDRFRNDRPRQDFQRPDYRRQEGGRDDGRSDSGPDNRPDNRQGRNEGRQDRPDYRQDQARSERRREEIEDAGANGLPAFLTTPVRTPIAVAEPEGDEGAPPAAVNGAAPHGEGNGRPRRRRRPRYEGPEGNGDTGADFAPEVDTPPAK